MTFRNKPGYSTTTLSWSPMEPGAWFTTKKSECKGFCTWGVNAVNLRCRYQFQKAYLWYMNIATTQALQHHNTLGKVKVPKSNSKPLGVTRRAKPWIWRWFSGKLVKPTYCRFPRILDCNNSTTGDVKVQNVNHSEIRSFQLDKGMIWIWKQMFFLWMIMHTGKNPARGTLTTHKFAVLNQSWGWNCHRVNLNRDIVFCKKSLI